MGRTRRKRRRRQGLTAKTFHNEPEIKNLLKELKKKYNWTNNTHLKICYFPETGRGITSKISFSLNSTLIEIPWSAMISLATINESEMSIFKPNTSFATLTVLAVFLCLEVHKQAKSRWNSYLASLPKENPLGHLELTDAEIKKLPSMLRENLISFRNRFQNAYSSVLQNIIATDKCSCCEGYFADCVFRRDLFAWSYALINSRAVFVDPQFVVRQAEGKFQSGIYLRRISLQDSPNMALCPFLDMFNHDFSAQTKADIVDDAYSSQYYRLKTLTKFRKHDQIFISYGGHDNIKLFVEYGFFIPNNPLDVFHIDFEGFLETFNINLDAQLYKYIVSKGLNRDLYIFLSGELSFNLKALMFLCTNGRKTTSNKIFTETYSEVEIELFKKMATKLLSSKDERNLYKFSNSATNQFAYYLLVDLPNTIRTQIENS